METAAQSPTEAEEAGAVVLLTAKVDAEVAARLAQVEVVVTATDMPAMRQTLAVDGDRIVGTVAEIPAGAARLFTVIGYDAAGTLVASGSAKLDLSPGQSVPLGLTLAIDPSPSRSQPSITVELAPGVPLDMVWIEPGVFTMGSPLDELGRNDDEGPQREVRLTQGFYLSQCEITQRQWTAVTGERPWSHYADELKEEPDRPAVYISWEDVQEFIAALNAAADGQVYRLPTEAEWEYAGRAGTKTPWSFGDVEKGTGSPRLVDGQCFPRRAAGRSASRVKNAQSLGTIRYARQCVGVGGRLVGCVSGGAAD